LGIVVKNPSERNKGFGSESVKLLLGYAFQVLNVHQIFVNVAETNSASIKLFSNFGFQKIGVKKQWNKIGSVYVDETLYQLINPLNEN